MYDDKDKRDNIINAIQDYLEQYREKPLKDLFLMLKGLTPLKMKAFVLSVYRAKIYKNTEEEENDLALIEEIKEKF